MIADNTDFPGVPKYLEYVRSGGSRSVRYESGGYESKTKRGPVSIPLLKFAGNLLTLAPTECRGNQHCCEGLIGACNMHCL